MGKCVAVAPGLVHDRPFVFENGPPSGPRNPGSIRRTELLPYVAYLASTTEDGFGFRPLEWAIPCLIRQWGNSPG
jgi:hypothetical protein